VVYRPVDVPPHPVDLGVGLVDVPPVAGRVAGKPGGVGQQRRKPLHPPVDADVVDLDPTFDQQFFHVAVGQVEPQVPADRDDDHLGREPEPGERGLRW
jgi:hypothetical protein